MVVVVVEVVAVVDVVAAVVVVVVVVNVRPALVLCPRLRLFRDDCWEPLLTL